MKIVKRTKLIKTREKAFVIWHHTSLVVVLLGELILLLSDIAMVHYNISTRLNKHVQCTWMCTSDFLLNAHIVI